MSKLRLINFLKEKQEDTRTIKIWTSTFDGGGNTTCPMIYELMGTIVFNICASLLSILTAIWSTIFYIGISVGLSAYFHG